MSASGTRTSLLDAERLLAEYRGEVWTGASQRDKTRVVTYNVPDQCRAVVEQLGRHGNTARTVQGPGLLILLPEEQFRVFGPPI